MRGRPVRPAGWLFCTKHTCMLRRFLGEGAGLLLASTLLKHADDTTVRAQDGAD